MLSGILCCQKNRTYSIIDHLQGNVWLGLGQSSLPQLVSQILQLKGFNGSI